ncbi:unnamed protein product [Rhizophagus irregularis]|nr:unnamed protein product [Rhizophagus irregularis]
MLEEIFNVTNYKLFWANGESSTSKERRKSDDSLHEQFGYSSMFGNIWNSSLKDVNFCISNFNSLLEKADRSIEELNRPDYSHWSVLP